ncbi:unnamed protein product [Didymodactylos carnosus]|uniref:Dual specificity protein phosphatase n=1 Tax=Didymodactylos carnosus TaxID=1234261 RepID=A0A8S2DKJ6_9BILA|nr:unnamed protein product [Didymodactylos carnosus]CAF3723352.1 unnamed protein product [Didymodactylos carnosus]
MRGISVLIIISLLIVGCAVLLSRVRSIESILYHLFHHLDIIFNYRLSSNFFINTIYKYYFQIFDRDSHRSEFQLVAPSLYISNKFGCYNENKLIKYNITHILIAGSLLTKRFPSRYRYHQLNLRDIPSENIGQYFAECVDFIEQAIESKGTVVVHCSAGMSRSAAIVVAYMMHAKKLTFDQAYSKLKEVRPCVGINDGFQKQLRAWQKEGMPL